MTSLFTPPPGSRIAVGLSGGVDSSLAIRLLKEQGYDVLGLTMSIQNEDIDVIASGAKGACFGPGEEENNEISAQLCQDLGVPFHIIDLKEEYKATVLEYFRSEYLSGRTPNPCVVCNHRLKFGFLMSKAREQGIEFDYFATGHYCQIVENQGKKRLSRAAFRPKDQTYFLWGLPAEQLKELYFPLGGMTKDDVRELAQKNGLQSADRPDSQDFVDGGSYAPLFKDSEIKTGDIVSTSGDVLGQHKGIIHYTIGQRKGLGISSPKPLFVLRLDAKKNQVVVTDNEKLFSQNIITENLYLHDESLFSEGMEVEACPRLLRKGHPAKLYRTPEGGARVEFLEAQRAVAPGQSLVLYLDDMVFGGGIISEAF